MIWHLSPSLTAANFDAALGFIPSFLSLDDTSPAAQQFATHYIGGWFPFKGFRRTVGELHYPGDPPLALLAYTQLRDERIEVYEYAWVCIVQPGGQYEIARMD